MIQATSSLVHPLHQLIDLLLAIAQISTLDKVPELARLEASGGVAELEGPEEVARLLEVGANGDNLVDQVLHADDAVLAEVVFDQLVVGESNALPVNLAISALVDELAHRLERGVSIGNPGLHNLEHFSGCLGETYEHTVVDLE